MEYVLFSKIDQVFSLKKKNTENMEKILEKSGNFVSGNHVILNTPLQIHKRP